MPPLGTQKFGFFPLQTGSVVDATGAGLEGIVEAVICAGPELLTAWQSFKKWWPKSLPFAKCEYFVAKRNAALWFLHSSPFPCVGGKKGQECEWYKISYVLKKPKEAVYLSWFCQDTILSLMPMWFFFHMIETFMVFLMTSTENVKHWFSF